MIENHLFLSGRDVVLSLVTKIDGREIRTKNIDI